MSTNIQIDVVLQRLQEQARQVLGQNREERLEREEVQLAAQNNRSTRQGRQPLPAASTTSSQQTSSTELRQRSADEHSAVPDTYKQRRPAAQRNASVWGILTVDWLPNTVNEIYYTTGAFGETITNSVNVVTQRPIRLNLTKSSDTLSKPSAQVYSTATSASAFDDLFLNHHTNGAVNTVSGNRSLPVIDGSGLFGRDFYGRAGSETAIGGNTYYTAAPVTASSGSALYGCVQTFFISGTPGWELAPSGSRYFPNGLRYTSLFVYFKYDTATGLIKLNSSFVLTQINDSLTDQTTKQQAFAAHMPGGSIWVEQYVANCISGDPSLALRAAGYRGDYHIKNGKAYFLRYDNGLNAISAAARRGISLSDLKWFGYDITSAGTSLVEELTDYYIGMTGEATDVKDALSGKDAQKYGDLNEREYNAVLSKFASQHPGGAFAAQAGPLLYPLLTPP